MSVMPIGGVSAVTPSWALAGPSSAGATGPGFEQALGASVDNLQKMQSTSSSLALKAVTGDLDDVHDYTIASSQASLTLELTAALRNKAVDAFTEIMRMQA